MRFSTFQGAEIFRVPIITRGSRKFKLLLNYVSFVVSATIFGLIWLRNRQFDIIFVYEPSPITVVLPAIFLGKKHKAPVVLWVLDLWPDTLRAFGFSKYPRLLNVITRLVSYCYNQCTFVLGQSKSFTKSIQQLTQDKDSVLFYPSWAEEQFETVAIEPRNNAEFFNIVFAGNLGEAQDFPSVMQAITVLRRYENLKWTFVGDGRMHPWLKAEVERHGLAQTVDLPGKKDISEMPQVFEEADALLISLKDTDVFSKTIPAKLQAYMMAGKPVIGMVNGEAADLINEARCGFTCDAGDHEGLVSITEAFLALASEERQKMGLSARKYAKENFSRSVLVDKVEAIFETARRSKGQTGE